MSTQPMETQIRIARDSQRDPRAVLFGLDHEAEVLWARLDEANGVLDPELERAFDDWTARRDNAIEMLHRAIRLANSEEAQARTESERFRLYAERQARNAARLKDQLFAAQQASGEKTCSSPLATSTVTKGRSKTVLDASPDDERLAPYAVPQPPKVDMRAVSRALKAGEDVPAHEERGDDFVTIRWKED